MKDLINSARFEWSSNEVAMEQTIVKFVMNTTTLREDRRNWIYDISEENVVSYEVCVFTDPTIFANVTFLVVSACYKQQLKQTRIKEQTFHGNYI